ncbi:MAG TPA: hypothetical protein VNA14_04970 [Mycobacteriales bacterium]|nr:hypothetical protein [Mycobacteriales bacterium]
MIILAQPEYGEALTTYRALGWVGAAAAMVVVVALAKRIAVSPRTFDVLRVVSAGYYLVLTASAIGAFLRFTSLVTTDSDTDGRGVKALLLALGSAAGVAAGWWVTNRDPSLEDEFEPDPPNVVPDQPADDDPDAFEVPPLVTIPEMPERVRWMLPFVATVAGLACLITADGLTDTGLAVGGFVNIETSYGAVAFIIGGLLAGLAALLPAWIREDEISFGVAASGLGVVAASIGLHGHIANRIPDSPLAAGLVAVAAGVLLPMAVDSIGELYEVLDRTAIWIGTSVLLAAMGVAAAFSLHGLQQGTPGIFFPTRDRLNCPPTCPPDQLPVPGLSGEPGPLPTLPSGFPTGLFPSDFPYHLFNPTPSG